MPLLRVTLPLSGVSSPRMIFKRVVFPSPLPPTKPTRSFSVSVVEASEIRGTPSYPNVICSRLISIGFPARLNNIEYEGHKVAHRAPYGGSVKGNDARRGGETCQETCQIKGCVVKRSLIPFGNKGRIRTSPLLREEVGEPECLGTVHDAAIFPRRDFSVQFGEVCNVAHGRILPHDGEGGIEGNRPREKGEHCKRIVAARGEHEVPYEQSL